MRGRCGGRYRRVELRRSVAKRFLRPDPSHRRLPTAASVPSCWKEPLLGMCAAHCNTTSSSQPSQKGKGKMPTIPRGSGSPWFPAYLAARPQPPGVRGRPAAAPRSSGCCSACGAEVGFIPCSPPAPRIWDEGAEAHPLHGPTAGLTTRRGFSGFSPWKVPAGGPQILLSNWRHTSVLMIKCKALGARLRRGR